MVKTNEVRAKKGINKAFSEHKIAYTIVYIIFTLYAITLVYPLLWVFVQSFRSKIDFFWYPLDFPQILLRGKLSEDIYRV